MAKNYNPADAYRKAQRAKEVKKNKEVRKKVRDVQTVKRDTRDLESEIRSLRDKKDNASKSRIAELESELAYIVKTKEAYVKEHPDAKDKVFKPRGAGGGGRGGDGQGQGEEEGDENGASGSGAEWKGRERLYDETTGRLRDPTRSAYYDPVYNPWGAPPPGMPYKERPGLTPLYGAEGDDDSDEEADESDEEIVMPEGPPPADLDDNGDDSDEEEEDDDDIPLPTGPPPPKPVAIPPSGPAAWGGRAPPLPVPFHQPPIHMGGPSGMPYPPFPPPQQQAFFPPQPPPQQPMRQFRPSRNGPPRSVQDPLDDAPTQTYQGYHASLPARPPPSDPSAPGPITGLPGSVPVRPAPATATSRAAPVEISAAPVLRDLRKEATVFVPRNLKRKAPPGSGGGGGGGSGRINAAPGGGVVDEEGDERVVRRSETGLMGKLKGVLGPDLGTGGAGAGSRRSVKDSADEDYERFLAGLGDIS